VKLKTKHDGKCDAHGCRAVWEVFSGPDGMLVRRFSRSVRFCLKHVSEANEIYETDGRRIGGYRHPIKPDADKDESDNANAL
jgi:hypothetical protein